jgi:hypothetical protein
LRTDGDTHSRWSVAGGRSRSGRVRPADIFRSQLARAARRREACLVDTGRPTSMDHAERHMNWQVLARGVRRGALSGFLRWGGLDPIRTRPTMIRPSRQASPAGGSVGSAGSPSARRAAPGTTPEPASPHASSSSAACREPVRAGAAVAPMAGTGRCRSGVRIHVPPTARHGLRTARCPSRLRSAGSSSSAVLAGADANRWPPGTCQSRGIGTHSHPRATGMWELWRGGDARSR